ncbi:MAG: ribosome hibernation-promoting factor, HPF/YfiA family [Thermoguttaceae bacterium]
MEQINISARHGHISEATQGKIREKLEKLPRLYDRIMAIELTIDLEHRETPSVDLKVLVKHKPDFLASTSAADLMSAVDEVIEKILQQLRKHKGKDQDRQRGASSR